ncbi:MAG: WYL domain-containing protein [Gallionella sp.]|nr:WYL domain-containing protein [Gallionella sp.]
MSHHSTTAPHNKNMTASHETIVYRLVQILIKLNQGEKLNPLQLCEEFHVTLRTIQRDLNERFAYLPLQRTGKLYHLDPIYLGKLNTRDIERFAALAGMHGMFPSLSDDFLRDVFDASIQSALLIKGHHYEDLAGKAELFRSIEQAIVARNKISFHYPSRGELKRYTDIEPYKLINNKGIWYMAARHGEKLKTFSFTRLDRLEILSGSHFEFDPAVDKTLQEEDGIWLGEKKEIVLKISCEVADYFKRRKLIAHQVIEKELEDGGLIISAKVGHLNQIIPIVRYWIPHIRIISPEGLQAEMEGEIEKYLSK